jgi:hypothetical protein
MILDKEYYKRHEIYRSLMEEKETSMVNTALHMFLEVKGEYNFAGLNLIGYGWDRIYPMNIKPETIASVQDKKIFEPDYLKTLIFENKNEGAMAMIYLDMINHYHEIDLSARNSPDKNMDTLNRTKSMLERELSTQSNKCKLEPRKIISLESMDKVESN